MGFVRWPMDRFLKRLASPHPVPGGGSAAALAGSLGAALGSMVCAILLTRPKLRSAERKALQRHHRSLEKIRRQLANLIQQDSQAYLALIGAIRTRKGIPQAHEKAVQSPLRICEAVVEANRQLRMLGRRTGPSLGSDVKAARALLRGAFQAAFGMAEMNLRGSAGHPRGARRMLHRLIRLRNSLER